jgi:hypothetical protein
VDFTGKTAIVTGAGNPGVVSRASVDNAERGNRPVNLLQLTNAFGLYR